MNSLQWIEKYNLIIFDEIDSTNSECLRLARSQTSGDYIIWAKSQKAGRGTNTKQWDSPIGNLYLSILLDRNIYTQHQTQFSFIASLSVLDSIKSLLQMTDISSQITLKWPNDVLIKNKKVAGILLESISINQKNYLIIGIGINVNNYPTNTNIPATSLLSEGIVVNLEKLLNIFINTMNYNIEDWESNGFETLRLRWLSNAAFLNKSIAILNENRTITGIFKDIDHFGNIKLELPNGNIYTKSSGIMIF
jgi:BirA family biotin operon repressor/biotin-[acetyl-CoA-carboxylase] ligase